MPQKPVATVYKSVPVLLKGQKRSIQSALPSALHIAATATVSVLIFAVINISATYGLGPKHKWTKLINQGTMMAMITITILAMPCLGKSVTKGVQRIAGVIIGGWLFFGLYAACQLWWFLAVCLAVWAFVLVALSFFLTGKQFLFPVALITAFIVAVHFNTVEQALTMTAVKTVAISGAIVVYTLASMLLFPLTATQQLITALSGALSELHHLAHVLLVEGQANPADSASACTSVSKDVGDTVKSVDTGAVAAAAAAAVPAAVAKKPGKASKAKAAAAVSQAALLAAQAAHSLQLVELLLPATKNERYVGNMGSCRCFLPSIAPRGLDESSVLSVSFNASQVLRALMTILADFGSVPMAQRTPPAQLQGTVVDAQHLMLPLAEHAVASLKDLVNALPPSGPTCSSVCATNLSAFAATLKELIVATVDAPTSQQAMPIAGPTAGGDGISQGSTAAAAAAGADDSRGRSASTAAGAAGKWQQAAAAAVGSATTPGSRQHSADQIAAAFGQLLSDAVTSDEAQIARWCTLLVLSRQLGKALAALTASVNGLLPVLPGAHVDKDDVRLGDGTPAV